MPESARTPTTEWYRSSLSMLHSKSLDSRSSSHLYLKQKRGIYFQSIKIGKVIVLASLSSWHNWKTSCNYLPFESKMCHTQQILETSASAGSLHHSCHFSKKDSGKCWQDSAMNRAFKPFSPHTSGSSLSLCHMYSCAVKYIKVHFKNLEISLIKISHQMCDCLTYPQRKCKGMKTTRKLLWVSTPQSQVDATEKLRLARPATTKF